MSVKKELRLIMQNIASASIQRVLDGKTYSSENAEKWGAEIIKELLEEIQKVSKGRYKFVANAIIFPSSKQCINNTQIALHDIKKDEKIITKWGNDSMQCILSLWAFKTRLG